MDESKENSSLLEHNQGSSSTKKSTASPARVQCKVYKRRWYVLSVFTASAFIFNMAWNTWGPIQEPTKLAFGWTDFDILLLTSWTPISFIVSSLPLTWLMDSKGLRVSVLLISFLSVLGKALQVIQFHDKKVRAIFIHIGQFFVMSGAPVSMGGPPLVSATWFPPNERTTATAIGTLAGYFGIAIAFAVGPAMVPNEVAPTNGSNLSISKRADHNLIQYTYFELGLCVVVFLCALMYFPARPPLPPSLSSSTHTLSTSASLKQAMRNCKLLPLAAMTGLTYGIYFGWLSMLDVFLAKFHVDANTAGWLGCAATLAGVVSGITLARCADCVKHKTKQLLVLLLTLSTISQLVFSLSCAEILPSTKPLLYSSIIFGGFVYNGTLPLFFELAMESVYPVGEGIAGGILIAAGNVVLLLFYIAFMLPHSDVRWMNWVTVAILGVCAIGLLCYKEQYTYTP
ncbi:hypothetical protein ACROYT_G036979 [Oculina patagonica]